ncbi:reverse transcriptase domain-containing protein [Tanacetum coccineum]
MSDNIPFDIQIEIIKKVADVKSLIRFRSVSKPWMAFIDSPEFIACFGVRHTQPHSLLLSYKQAYEVKYVSFVDDVTFPQQQQDFTPNVSDLVKQLKDSTVIGSSCGLWCLHGFNSSGTQEMLVIWNPSITKSVGIVVPCVLTNTSEKTTNFCFGVCPSTYDPTIVIMSHTYWFLERKVTHKWQVRIFTLSSKTWKMIPSSNLPLESILRVTTQVSIGRFIYLFSHVRIVGNDAVPEIQNLILSFDLITHEFKEINLPHSLANRFSLNFSISKLSESLVVSTYIYEAEKLVYGVWMMGEEGGVMPSFTKLFNIKTPNEISVSKVLGFTMSGEPIMETKKDYGEFIAKAEVYLPCSEHINDLGINGEDGSFFICPYTETLLLVDHSDCCIISNDS